MKKIIVSITIALCVMQANGQVKENIAVSVVVPQQVDDLNDAQTVRLGKKMLDIATKSGLSASGRNSGIIMYPVFSIEKEDVVEGGMKNLVVVYADISFIIGQVENEMVFATHNLQVRGSGNTRQRAINDAISKISVKDSDFGQFVAAGRQKIIDYYTNNCSNVILTAQSYAQRKEYEAAIALLASIPDAAACYPQALKEIEKFYPEYEKQSCNVIVQKAQSLYAAHQYTGALSVLYDLKVFETDCTQEAKALSKTIESKLTAEEQRAWDFMVQQNNHRAALAEKRLETVQAIAVSYYNRKIHNHYNILLY